MSIRHLLCAVCLILSGLDPSNSHAGSGVAGWEIDDSTGTIELQSVQEDDSMLTLSLKNRSAEVISAVALCFEEEVYHYQDWMNAEPSGLAPGHIFDITVGAEEGKNRALRISAVLFEDASGKGNQVQLDLMNFHRFGQILESARVGDILHNSNPTRDDASMNAVMQKIGRMPLSSEDAFLSVSGVDIAGIRLSELRQSSDKLRTALFWGVSTARERALRQMENVKQLPVVSADEKTPSRGAVLSFLQELYDTQNKKAIALLARMQGGR